MKYLVKKFYVVDCLAMPIPVDLLCKVLPSKA